MKKPAIMTAFILLMVSRGFAGTISPALEAGMNDLADQDLIKVLVIMQDQPDIRTLDKSLHTDRVTLAERHSAVVSTLQDAALASQKDLLDSLAGNKSAGRIVGYVPHWIINAVVVKGTVAAIRDLSTRSDVKTVEMDMEVELIEPVMEKEAPRPRDKSATGFVTTGVTAIGADRVWHELGFDGTGTLVANMDSGVDGTHPALAARWRGNTASAGESWQDIADAGSPSFPYDGVGHGTHVMGTITGATAFDTTGVAPGAEWIASNAIAGNSGLDIAVIAAFEWMADPDGNPDTTDDVPDVCHNSWGVLPEYGAQPCDTSWWDVIDNCEAAGVVVTFSAGNEGPGAGTLRFPAYRASTPTNCFSVGSTSLNPPYVVSEFSSRGPSPCGGPYEVKPEIMAPGEDIYSSLPGGGYGYMDGTSMAGPHVAGVVALMRQAAPDLDVTTIKEILMETAIDLGVPGEDNDYGHGFIDAYKAVTMVMNNRGTITGTITDQGTGLPIAGAVVRDMRGFTQTASDSAGVYRFTILGGQTTLKVDAFGYFTANLDITVPEAGTLEMDITLTAMPSATVSGTVRGPDGLPVSGADISALGTPVDPVASNASGFYTLTLPSGEDVAYDLLAIAPNLAYSLRNTGLQDDRTMDFDLPELQSDGFESGGFTTYDWQLTGDVPWTVGSDQAYEGVLSARSGAISDGGVTELSLDYFVQGDGTLEFWYKVDSEELFDTLKFFIDGTLYETWSGAIDWTRHGVALASGSHNLKWVYAKDSSASVGQDAAWIDLVEFPGTGIQPNAGITLSTTTLNLSMGAGSTASLPLTIGNIGDNQLDYVTNATDGAKTDLPWLTVIPATGTVHPSSVKTLSVEFDSNFLWAGTHTAELVISSNDPAHPDTLVAVELMVTPVSAVGDGLPRHLVIHGPVPNPFNPATDIKFSLPGSADVRLGVYDVGGRLVRTLLAERMTAGAHSQRWDGRDNAGLDVASGIYFARLRSDGETSIKSMALVR